MRKLRVLLAEDHPLMIEAVKLALGGSAEFEVVAVTSSGSDVVALAERVRPDLVLLDLSLPGADGLDVLHALRGAVSDAVVVVLSGHDDAGSVDSALRGGATGFISKRIDPQDLSSALRQVLDSTVFRPLEVPADGTATADPALTPRELDVLRALLDGLSNKEIGERLWLSEQAVKARLTTLYRKLGASSRTEAVAMAYGRGFNGSSQAKSGSRRLAGS